MSKKRPPNFGDRIARSRRAREKLGTDTPACSVCGENRTAILEKHHIAGRKYDPETMILCRNHHGLMSDAQKDYPNGGDPSNKLECIGQMLLNLADLFTVLIEKLKEFGVYLIELARSETNVPESKS